MIIETKRLVLKPIQVEDASFLMNLMNSPKFIQHIGDRKISSIDIAENYIRSKMHTAFEKSGFPNFVLTLKDNGNKIGTCGIYDRDTLDGVDLGYALLPEYEQLGYATEAATAVIDIAKNQFKIGSIKAITTHENVDSQKVLNKLNFKYIKDIEMEGDDEILMLFELNF